MGEQKLPAQAEMLAAEDRFFSALLDGNTDTLGELLTDDFVLVDVISGDLVRRDGLLEVLASGELAFVAVDRSPGEVRLRQRSGLAVVVGPTAMVMRYRGETVTAGSRYTHVYIQDEGRWQLLTAQGTHLSDTPAAS